MFGVISSVRDFVRTWQKILISLFHKRFLENEHLFAQYNADSKHTLIRGFLASGNGGWNTLKVSDKSMTFVHVCRFDLMFVYFSTSSATVNLCIILDADQFVLLQIEPIKTNYLLKWCN